MLEPRGTDIPALFLVFVVLPLVSYLILGKWSDTARKKDRRSLIAKAESEDMAVGSVMPIVHFPEAVQVHDMEAASVMPLLHLPNSGVRYCARCYSPATTRCSQCKSVWYCSGRCQIVHWRQVHKLECPQLGKDCHKSSLKPTSSEESCGRVSYSETKEQGMTPTKSGRSVINRKSEEMGTKGNKDSSRTADGAVLNSPQEGSGIGFTPLATSQSSEDAYLRCSDFAVSEDDHTNIPRVSNNEDGDLRGALHENSTVQGDETKGSHSSSEKTPLKRSSKSRVVSDSHGVEQYKSPKSRVKVSKESLSSDTKMKVRTANESRVVTTKENNPSLESNRPAAQGIMWMMSMKKSIKPDHQHHSDDSGNRLRKLKMIFPYEEFVKYFQFEVFNMAPRGLVNCGNSCYANAVLQCLTCTKPLINYLLRQSHSRTGCAKDWCLMCELEHLVMMLRENGGPLSPMNILMYIRSLNSQIGDGSQEDAHEFLRLLVASLQTICLEGFGGENAVDPRLQETTFIQHMFGGSLRSKVKCLRCHHESERYENMMDLTLEIFGWVETLEDALTQFTSSEDLDGENMYRCARCATYVRARKQLNIKEAPNILTIVLKRFQEGSYGKINKCITFPEMLDMVPFMTGTDDIPPLYMLYGVVVHLDTSNASFSGHYISYVKDLQGSWYRIDDTVVQPVEWSQVMSEGAYILFYMRSYPRPIRGCSGKSSKHGPSKTHRSAKTSQKTNHNSSDHKLETNADCNVSRDILVRESKSRPSILRNHHSEFSDATSSEWSLFTSSDDSSFTTESTRDSFSTVDHADVNSLSSIFPPLYQVDPTSRRSISCSMFPGSKAQTRFAGQEKKGFVSVSCLGGSDQDPRREGVYHGVHVNYGIETRRGLPQTSL